MNNPENSNLEYFEIKETVAGKRNASLCCGLLCLGIFLIIIVVGIFAVIQEPTGDFFLALTVSLLVAGLSLLAVFCYTSVQLSDAFSLYKGVGLKLNLDDILEIRISKNKKKSEAC
ncbi:MAG: hypothetical protein GF311_16560 [Candidatus Lokiarchaeota archaeon]|nr:hypothetical protein [Candidatus Lokiarchaeota archaeon]